MKATMNGLFYDFTIMGEELEEPEQATMYISTVVACYIKEEGLYPEDLLEILEAEGYLALEAREYFLIYLEDLELQIGFFIEPSDQHDGYFISTHRVDWVERWEVFQNTCPILGLS